MPAPPSRRLPPLASVLLFLLLAMLQLSAWIWLSLRTGGLWTAMALAAAAVAALSLRWGGMAAGPARTLWAVAGTLVVAAAGCWLVIAAQVGWDIGVGMPASALRLGPHLAWTLLKLAAGPWDVAALLAAPVLAWASTASGPRR